MGSTENNEYHKHLLRKGTSVQHLAEAVGYYDTVQTEIQVEKTSDDSVCIQVDTSKIKQHLENLNFEEQKMLLNKIKDQAIQELHDLDEKFYESEQTFAHKPDDLKKLKASIDLVESLISQKPVIEESLVPLEEKLRLLDEYMVMFKEEEKRQRAGIRESFSRFC